MGTDLRGATQVEAAPTEEQAREQWVQTHLHKLDNRLTLPILAIGTMLLFPIVCIIAMHSAKPVKGDKYSGCEGWGPCLLFGGLTMLFWIYTALVGYGVLTFRTT